MTEVNEETSWRETLSEDLKSDVSLEKFKSVDDLAKSYKHLEIKIGKDKVIIPKSDSEWSDFYKAAGRPEDPSGYELKVPETYNKEHVTQFVTEAHALGLNPNQLQGVMDVYSKQVESETAMLESANTETIQKLESDLRAKYGESYEDKKKGLDSFIQKNADETYVRYLNESGLGNDPRHINFLMNVASKFSGDSLDGEGKPELNASQAKEELSKLRESAAYMSAGHLDHKNVMQKARDLVEIIG